MLWWFLPFVNMNWPWACVCPPILSLPRPTLPRPSFRSPQSPGMHQTLLGYLFARGDVYASVLFSQITPRCPPPSPEAYLYVSFAALHVGPSVPSFKMPYICINAWYLSLSF